MQARRMHSIRLAMDERVCLGRLDKERRLRRRAPRRLPTSASWAHVASCLCGTAEAWEGSYDAFAVLAVRMSTLRLKNLSSSLFS